MRFLPKPTSLASCWGATMRLGYDRRRNLEFTVETLQVNWTHSFEYNCGFQFSKR